MFPLEELLKHIGVREEIAQKYAYAYIHVLKRYQIDTPLRLAAFLANLMVESGYLKRQVENLNYSAQGLAKTWPNRYRDKRTGRPNYLANKIARNPQLIANYTYSNRMGNGSPESGDGWKYRGRGPIQVTGKNNYKQLQEDTGMDVVNHPELLLEPGNGAISSCNFWFRNNINRYADRDDLDGCRDMVHKGRKTLTLESDQSYRDAKYIYAKIKDFYKKHNITKIELPSG